jgi:hypothetical protein
LILAGDDDFACPVSDAQELAENPSAFFQRIEEWLHRLPFPKLVE